MQRVTLNGINRRGLVNLNSRERWLAYSVRIWSRKRASYWLANCRGYTTDPEDAGVFPFADAYDAAKHCDRGEGIEFIRVKA